MLFEAVDETPGTKRTMTEGGLPDLVGIQSDIEQARTIRTEILTYADDVLTRLRSDEIITDAEKDTDIVSPRHVSSAQVHAAEAALNRLRSRSDASWWIGQSGRSAGEILSEMMAEGAG